ncbi:uncharacterized protein [Anabrus simplex]|uniref:uncharacterized protein n=1 Tax=Anabrus simplex TaxID=316456 RepID=UPI0034DD165B
MVLSEELVRQFQEDGAVVLRGVFSNHWVDVVRRGIQHNLEKPSLNGQWLRASETSGIYFNDYCNWRRIPEFEEYVRSSPVAEIAGILTKSKKIRFYHEHVLNKEPGTEKPTPWHHDQPYYPIDGDQVCSVWMPVDPISLSSSLRLVKGSHRWGRLFKPRLFATSEDYDLMNPDNKDDYETLSDEEMDTKHQILEWAVDPGDCVVFHMKTVHGAAGNSSMCSHRRVLATRWLGDDARLATRPWQVSPPLKETFKEGEEPSLDQLPILWEQKL